MQGRQKLTMDLYGDSMFKLSTKDLEAGYYFYSLIDINDAVHSFGAFIITK